MSPSQRAGSRWWAAPVPGPIQVGDEYGGRRKWRGRVQQQHEQQERGSDDPNSFHMDVSFQRAQQSLVSISKRDDTQNGQSGRVHLCWAGNSRIPLIGGAGGIWSC